ncbi:MAG TPA: NAD(P)H-hydrate dehydratase [Spirochaetota bacterium]|nr:NAD(P)H-hydrate dehydratase [Spirochaetota bacterium]
MKVVTAAEMREIDRAAIEDYGIPAEVLMNSAGKYTADFINERFPGCAVNILCGTGNNGGDGFTAAYYLFNSGRDVSIILCGKTDSVSTVSRIFMNICKKSGLTVNEYSDAGQIAGLTFNPGIIVDAIFGTGFSGLPSGVHREVIKKINSSGLKIVSLDIPSGLPSDGDIEGIEAVKADITITIGLPKVSIATYPGREFCGEVITADIGFPANLTSGSGLNVNLIEKNLVKASGLFTDIPDMHKGDRGHTLLSGGFPGMEGAILLTAKALFRTGAGLATLLTLPESRQVIAGKIPELMTDAVSNDDLSEWINCYLQNRKFTGLVIGPGMGRSEYAAMLFNALINSARGNGISRILIDGDGLYHLAGYLKSGRLPEGPEYCITPHFMEASRITGTSVEKHKSNRLQSCVDIARQTSSTVVLKGPATIVSDGKTSYINTTGNSRLATAGSGDVLSGIIASFMGRNCSIIEAASCGVFLHGLCADLFSVKNNFQLMKAGDIVKKIPIALNKIYE